MRAIRVTVPDWMTGDEAHLLYESVRNVAETHEASASLVGTWPDEADDDVGRLGD